MQRTTRAYILGNLGSLAEMLFSSTTYSEVWIVTNKAVVLLRADEFGGQLRMDDVSKTTRNTTKQVDRFFT